MTPWPYGDDTATSRADDKLLTGRAQAEGRSKQELAAEAIRIFLTRRTELFGDVLDKIMSEDAELLERLA